MLHFSLVRIYFYWLVFYADTSGTFSSAGAGWLCTAGLKLERGAWGGGWAEECDWVWERSCTRNHTARQKWVYCRQFRDNTCSEIPCLGWRVCISSPLPHVSVLRMDSFWVRINTRKQNIWILSFSRLFDWEALNWHFGIMIPVAAEL